MTRPGAFTSTPRGSFDQADAGLRREAVLAVEAVYRDWRMLEVPWLARYKPGRDWWREFAKRDRN